MALLQVLLLRSSIVIVTVGSFQIASVNFNFGRHLNNSPLVNFNSKRIRAFLAFNESESAWVLLFGHN